MGLVEQVYAAALNAGLLRDCRWQLKTKIIMRKIYHTVSLLLITAGLARW